LFRPGLDLLVFFDEQPELVEETRGADFGHGGHPGFLIAIPDGEELAFVLLPEEGFADSLFAAADSAAVGDEGVAAPVGDNDAADGAVDAADGEVHLTADGEGRALREMRTEAVPVAVFEIQIRGMPEADILGPEDLHAGVAAGPADVRFDWLGAVIEKGLPDGFVGFADFGWGFDNVERHGGGLGGRG